MNRMDDLDEAESEYYYNCEKVCKKLGVKFIELNKTHLQYEFQGLYLTLPDSIMRKIVEMYVYSENAKWAAQLILKGK